MGTQSDDKTCEYCRTIDGYLSQFISAMVDLQERRKELHNKHQELQTAIDDYSAPIGSRPTQTDMDRVKRLKDEVEADHDAILSRFKATYPRGFCYCSNPQNADEANDTESAPPMNGYEDEEGNWIDTDENLTVMKE